MDTESEQSESEETELFLEFEEIKSENLGSNSNILQTEIEDSKVN